MSKPYPDHPRMPYGPPPQRPQERSGLSGPMTRTEWRAWQARLAETNARYRREVDPHYVPPSPSAPEPAPNLWERAGDLLGRARW
jgi:hypothetical protein